MTGKEPTKALPSLHKYMRRRKLVSKSGFYLEIKDNGEVSCTKDETSVYNSLLFLSVGPNFIAIVGEQAKRYLAINEQGHVFTTNSERKDCVFREFLGRNFFSLFRTCHSDTKGQGWYLSINDLGKIRAEKVSFSDRHQLHFLVKVVKKEIQEKKVAHEPVWIQRSSESLDYSSSSSLLSKSGRSGSASPNSNTSGQSEYGSPVGFLSGDPGLAGPVSLRDPSVYGSPLPFPQNPGRERPVSASGVSGYGSPLPFPQNPGRERPVSASGITEYGSPLPFPQSPSHASPVSLSSLSEYGSPLPFLPSPSDVRPVSASGLSEYGSPLPFHHNPGKIGPVSLAGRSGYGEVLSSPRSLSYARPVSASGLSEYGSPLPFPQSPGQTSVVNATGRSGNGRAVCSPPSPGHARPVSVSGLSEYSSPLPLTQHLDTKRPPSLPVHSTYGSPRLSTTHRSCQTSPVEVPSQSGKASPESLTPSQSGSSSFSSKESIRSGKTYRYTTS